MLGEGPFSARLHGILEYVAGGACILAPVVLDFDTPGAVAVSIGAGLAILVVAATSVGPMGLTREVAPPIHVVLDLLIALVLIVAPFIAGFADQLVPSIFLIALGVALLLVTIGTRF